MPQQKTLTARDAKLVQWLNEAYTKEVELEAVDRGSLGECHEQAGRPDELEHLVSGRAETGQ